MHSSIHRKNIYWLCRGLYLFINKIQCLSKNVSSKICLTTNPVCPHGLWGQGSNVPGVQIAGTVQRDLNACNRQGTRLRKNYKVTQNFENWGHGENDILFKGWRCNENYKPKTNRPQTLRSSSLLRRNKVRSKTSENKRQKIQFKEYSENNMYILKPRNCQTYFRDSDLSFIV